ncbi:hypothetical protein CIHG_02590 [Coccidioides immitis H538.4]|uniref:Uncharacterized protein n=1 Tax=Coccidioides immitis H538.4 TaxID=396776 RepID=A0A0J8RJG7_COCIT|nr:hypothetical protein CIHG_02590 [Coccidioides immitis H538.4]
MGAAWMPRILKPDYTWPRPMPSTISETTPLIPAAPSRNTCWLWAIVYKALFHFSKQYCCWFGHQFSNVAELHFGLIMKWTDQTSLEEVVTMQMARAAGIHVPKLLSCGEHVGDSYNQVFLILMTRLPGIFLEYSSDLFEHNNEDLWIHKLKLCPDSIHLWQILFDQNHICSVLGTPIRSTRVPNHIMGLFTSERELTQYLLAPAFTYSFKSRAEYDETFMRAKRIEQVPHQVTFTHGDFKAQYPCRLQPAFVQFS